MRFRSSRNDEIYYVAEQKEKQYVLVVDVNKMGGDFGQQSGTYEMVSGASLGTASHWIMQHSRYRL